jgi:hypothetical protein
VETCNFTFGNDRLWKALDASILTAIRHVDGAFAGPDQLNATFMMRVALSTITAIPLSPPTLDATMLADSLQAELRKLIAGHRVSCGVRCLLHCFG